MSTIPKSRQATRWSVLAVLLVAASLLVPAVHPAPAAAGGAFQASAPIRLLDTRAGSSVGPYQTAFAGGAIRDLQVAGRAGVGADATAAVLNVTATNTATDGYLTVYGSGLVRPGTSSLNWAAGQTVPNLVEVQLGTGGAISIYNFAGAADVVVDLAGWVSATSTGPSGLFNPLQPARALDSRRSSALGPAEARRLSLSGIAGVPSRGVSAVVLNLTVTGPTDSGYLTVYPGDGTRPLASNLNFRAGQTASNRVTVQLGAAGDLMVFNSAGATDVVVDVNGWFTDGSGLEGGLFVGLPPARLVDSRNATGGLNGPLGASQTAEIVAAGQAGLPAMVKGAAPSALVANLTVTGPTAASYLAAWPQGENRPLSSDLNFGPAQTIASLVVVKLGGDGRFDLYNLSGCSDVVVDVIGYYTGGIPGTTATVVDLASACHPAREPRPSPSPPPGGAGGGGGGGGGGSGTPTPGPSAGGGPTPPPTPAPTPPPTAPPTPPPTAPPTPPPPP